MGLAVFRIAQLISVMTLFQTTTTSHKSTLTKSHTIEAQCLYLEDALGDELVVLFLEDMEEELCSFKAGA